MYTLPWCLITVGGGAEIDIHPATVPDYWGPRSMYTLSRCLITGGGAEIDIHPATVPDYWGPRSMYTLPRCLITGGGAEIDIHPATVPDYWGAEIHVPLTYMYIYHYVIKLYVRFL